MSVTVFFNISFIYTISNTTPLICIVLNNYEDKTTHGLIVSCVMFGQQQHQAIDGGALQQSQNSGVAAVSSEPKWHGCLRQKLLNAAGTMKSFCKTLHCCGSKQLPSQTWTEFQHFTRMFYEVECDSSSLGGFPLWTQLMMSTSFKIQLWNKRWQPYLPTRYFGLCLACVLWSNIWHSSRAAAIVLELNPDKLFACVNVCMCERQCQRSLFQPAAWWTDRVGGHTT